MFFLCVCSKIKSPSRQHVHGCRRVSVLLFYWRKTCPWWVWGWKQNNSDIVTAATGCSSYISCLICLYPPPLPWPHKTLTSFRSSCVRHVCVYIVCRPPETNKNKLDHYFPFEQLNGSQEGITKNKQHFFTLYILVFIFSFTFVLHVTYFYLLVPIIWV